MSHPAPRTNNHQKSDTAIGKAIPSHYVDQTDATGAAHMHEPYHQFRAPLANEYRDSRSGIQADLSVSSSIALSVPTIDQICEAANL